MIDYTDHTEAIQRASQKPLVIFHANCQDGFTAAWACWLKHPDWEYYPATHGNPPPHIDVDRDVYMLDFSYKKQQMLHIALAAGKVTVLDHHQSAEKDLSELLEGAVIFGRFDMAKSGARLAWEHFHPEELIPFLVSIVEDRDLWKFLYKSTRPVAAAIFSFEYDFVTWSMLARACENKNMQPGDRKYNLDSLISQGEAIERKHHKDIAELVKSCEMRSTIAGYDVPVANLPYTLASDACHLMCGDSEPFAATYYDGPEGRAYSLRSLPGGVDVSEVAKHYGGGGHRHAAGFRLSLGGSL